MIKKPYVYVGPKTARFVQPCAKGWEIRKIVDGIPGGVVEIRPTKRAVKLSIDRRDGVRGK